eukprot:1897430-Heterocapsa_arctica.AAC.1
MFKQQVGRERQFPRQKRHGMHKAIQQANDSRMDYRRHKRNGYDKKFHKHFRTIVKDHRDEY